MYKKRQPSTTNLTVNNTYPGETIEKKVNRIVNNKEPIKDGAPLIYTDRKEGTQAAYDIRTDRWELAVDAMDKVTQDRLAQREKRHVPKTIGEEAKEGMKKEGDGGAENIQGTGKA